MLGCLLVFLSVLPLLVTGCKKGESNISQSVPSPTASASPTPVAATKFWNIKPNADKKAVIE